MPLPSDIVSTLTILARGSQSVGAVMGNDSQENRFTRALEDLQRLSEQHQIPIAIVGGLGAIRYGYPAVTQDIDIAIGKSHLAKVIQVAPDFGFRVAWEAESGWHTLTHGDVEINVVPEGGKAKNTSPTTIPGPTELGVISGLGYASLASWMELKISSGRQKDIAHVVEVLKTCEREQIERIREHIAKVHRTYLTTLNRLIEEAEDEKQQEKGRSQR